MKFVKYVKFSVCAVVAMGLSASQVQAGPIPILNADFEANGPGFVQATSWVGSNTARVADHAGFRNQSALFGGGDNFAFTQGTTGPAEQTLATTFSGDFEYTLGVNANYGGGDQGVDAILELGYLDGAGAFQTVVSNQIDLAQFNGGNAGAGTSWAQISGATTLVSTGDAAVGQAITIRIQSSASQGLWFDNVTLDGTAIPEPSSAALVLLGMAGLAVTRRRR